MPRRKVVAKRKILPDPKYKDETLARFINYIMEDGKKNTAEKIAYGALGTIELKIGDGNGITAFLKAIENIGPEVEVRSRRVGGATYQIPVEVRESRKLALSMRWLANSARQRNEKSMTKRLAAEILEASENRGAAIKKRDDSHKMAEANRAFSHFRF